MDINSQGLNLIFKKVYPNTFTLGNEWIDLKDSKTGKPDGIKQQREIVENINDVGSVETLIDDDDIMNFARINFADIPREKINELVLESLNYIRATPIGDPFFDGTSPIGAAKFLSLSISLDSTYIDQVRELLNDKNFLIRWEAVGIIFNSEIKDLSIKESVLQDLENLYEKEQSKKIDNETPEIKITYYQVNELYDEYMLSLKGLIDSLKTN